MDRRSRSAKAGTPTSATHYSSKHYFHHSKTYSRRSAVFSLVEKLLSEMLNPRKGVPVGTHKAFLKDIPYAFTGYDLIEWMLEKFEIDDSEALHLANSICKLGYIFPVNDIKNLNVKDDSTLYRFQTSFFWLSHNLNNEDTDYAIYLVKRTLDTTKESSPLEPYEEENLEKLQLKLGDKWEFVCLQAEQQNKLAKERRKNDKIVLDSQEKAFWRIHRPPPNCLNALETAPILNAFSSTRNRKKTVEYLADEIDELKGAFTRCRWKSSDVIQSYINRWDNYFEFDPFVVKIEPSNPWVSDDNSLWSQNPNVLTPKRLKLWSLNFKELLKDEQGFQQFLEFLKKEYSSENIRFWQACQDFKKCPTSKRQEAVHRIYKEFLAPNAPKEINIDSYSRELVNKGVREGSRYALDLAQDHIYTLMKKDSYVRFLRSEFYKNLVAAAQNACKKKMILGFNFAPFMNLHHGVSGVGAIVNPQTTPSGLGAHSPSITGTGIRKCESVSSHLNILDSSDGAGSGAAKNSLTNTNLHTYLNGLETKIPCTAILHSSSTGDLNSIAAVPAGSSGGGIVISNVNLAGKLDVQPGELESQREKMLKRLQDLGYDPPYTGGVRGHYRSTNKNTNPNSQNSPHDALTHDEIEGGDRKKSVNNSLIMKLPKDLIEKEITSPIRTPARTPKSQASNKSGHSDYKISKDQEIIELTLKSPRKSKKLSEKRESIAQSPSSAKNSVKRGSKSLKSKEVKSPHLTDICPWEDEEEVKRIIASQKQTEQPSTKVAENVDDICPWENPGEVERVLADQKQKLGSGSLTSKASAPVQPKSPSSDADDVCPWENQEETLVSKEFEHEKISLKPKTANDKASAQSAPKTPVDEDVCPWENPEEIQSFEKKKLSGTPPVPIEIITMKPKPKLISGPGPSGESRNSPHKVPDKSNQQPNVNPSETRIRGNISTAANQFSTERQVPTIPTTKLSPTTSSSVKNARDSSPLNHKTPSQHPPVISPLQEALKAAANLTTNIVPKVENKHALGIKIPKANHAPTPSSRLQWGESTQL